MDLFTYCDSRYNICTVDTMATKMGGTAYIMEEQFWITDLVYPISTLPEHLHSTSLSYAETT